MNNFILMAEIIQEPQLRHTPDGLELAEMMVQFPGLRPDDPPAVLKAVGWEILPKKSIKIITKAIASCLKDA